MIAWEYEKHRHPRHMAQLNMVEPYTMICRDQISDFLDFFINAVDEWGPVGYLAYMGVYTGLEVLAVPAIPLTMTAGVILGPAAGTAVVSVSGTLAATIAFLIARYAVREKVRGRCGEGSDFLERAICCWGCLL